MPILAHGHLGIGRRDAAHNRRVATLAVRQHPVIGLQERSAKACGVEYVARRRTVAQAQPAAPRGDIAFGIQIAPIPIRPFRAVVIAAIRPQAPRAQVQSIAEIRERAVRAATLPVRRTGGVVRQAVRRPECGSAVIPQLRRDRPARLAIQRSLGDGNVKHVLVVVKTRPGRRQRGQCAFAAGGVELLQGRKGFNLHAHLL
ncbi:hypothetical protein D3C87_1170950 [compost metagenome]